MPEALTTEMSSLVDVKAKEFTELSHQIWDNPELRWNENDAVAAQIAAARRA